MTTSHDVITF